MMSRVRVTAVNRGRSVKRVTLLDVAATDTDDYLQRVAMVATREDRSSLFGASVTRYQDEGAAIVTLHTD